MTTKAMRVLLSLLATVMLAACTGSDDTGSSSPGPFPAPGRGVGDSLASRLQETLDEALARTDIPGAQAAVILPDGRAWSGASGLSDVDSERPVTPHTRFAIGSITKTFTAALVLRIAEDGLLSLDDPMTKWMPRFPDADGVTVRQLLDHTSGLAALAPSDVLDVLHREPNHRFTDAEVFLPPVCDPGACYHYQSPDYALLGRIAEKATGHSLASAYREALFDPLGLRESYFPSQEAVRGEVATGYGRDALTTGPADETASGTWIAPTSLPPAGAGLVSTAADVARFGAALFGEALLSSNTLAQTLDFKATAGLPGTDECGAYGLGVVRSSTLGRETWGHGGSTGNFHTVLEYFPRESVTVAVLVNGGSQGLGSITDEIARLALENSPVLHTDLGGGHCNYDIYAIRTNGSGLTRLTTDPATDGTPVAWSPDGSRIAFGSGRDGNAEIYVMNADGSNQVNLTNAPSGDFGAWWSPDGSQIAFFSDRSGTNEIYVMDSDGSDIRRLTRNKADDVMPAWSPDGSTIAYASGERESHDIWVMNADGSDPERLIGSDADDWWPAWSPDGTRIAYASVPSPTRPGKLYLVVANGSDPVGLDLPFEATYPAWSPSARIAFQDETGDIWTVQPDGSGLYQVTDSPATEFAPAWSPDGTMLAFPSERWVQAE